MQIREATERDLPEILSVLKASLGEFSSKKTTEVWRFKHQMNPFGKSLVLLAVENNQIIGIRAFMRWRWQLRDEVLSSLRAVDTATHPEHQGKGVFKKLTLEALEIAKEQGEHFIFNTPNSQSLPGYLKMKWEEINKIHLHFMLSNPLHWRHTPFKLEYKINKNCSKYQLQQIILTQNEVTKEQAGLVTLKSPEYLTWRYEDNPIQSYEIIADKDFYLAAYVKKHTYFNELRISEHIFNSKGLKPLKRGIRDLSKKFGAHMITYSSGLNYPMAISGNFGPILTFRDLNLEPGQKQELLQMSNWSYNLGDLELF